MILVDFRGRFGTKNHPKINKKRDRFSSEKREAKKREKRSSKGAMTLIEPRPGEHLSQIEGRWGVGG